MIFGFHKCEDVIFSFVGHNAMWTYQYRPVFWRNIQSPCLGLEYVSLKCWYLTKSPHCDNPEDCRQQA